MDGIRTELESYPEVSFIDHLGFSDFLASVIQDYQNAYREETGKMLCWEKRIPCGCFCIPVQ